MHISLDSALGRQRRLNQVGETISSIAAPAIAYSLRSLTGGDPKSVRVRRDTGGAAGDNDEQDFTVSEINSGALVSFVGSGNDGFVDTWYDQSGNGTNATQGAASEQPKIVSSGTLLNELEFDGSDDELDFTALNASDVSIFSVASFDDAAGQDRIMSGQGSSTGEGFGKGSATKGFFRANGGSARQPNLNVTISADQDILLSFIRASNTGTFFTNGTTSATFTDSNAFKAGSIGGAGSKIDGSLKELIIYNSDQTSSRTAIETNINSQYSIF